jgi:AcrR family transcriptional regulator
VTKDEGGNHVGDASEGRRPRSRLTDARWRKILDAAAEVFAARGYEGTGVRDIADNVGMLSGSLYYYIDSKEDLLYAIISDFHRMGLAAIDEVLSEPHPDALSRLRAVMVRSGTLNAEYPARSAVFYNEFRHLSAERQEDIRHDRRRHQARMIELIEQSQRDGALAQPLDPRLTAVSILSLLNATYTWYHKSPDLTPEQLGVFQADLLLSGMLARDSS